MRFDSDGLCLWILGLVVACPSLGDWTKVPHSENGFPVPVKNSEKNGRSRRVVEIEGRRR